LHRVATGGRQATLLRAYRSAEDGTQGAAFGANTEAEQVEDRTVAEAAVAISVRAAGRADDADIGPHRSPASRRASPASSAATTGVAAAAAAPAATATPAVAAIAATTAAISALPRFARLSPLAAPPPPFRFRFLVRQSSEADTREQRGESAATDTE
jgi:hypothetical protein